MRTVIKIFFSSFIVITIPALAQDFPSSSGPLQVTTVAKGLDHPWGMVFLPDGNMLLTERPGRMRIVSQDGKLSPPLANVPQVFAKGPQAGLLDVALDPDFANNHEIYFCYSEGTAEKAGTALAKAQLDNSKLNNVTVIFRQQPKVKSEMHWGCRIVFDQDQNIFLTLGERYDFREQAQDLSSDLGKLVHITKDGKPAPNNPFLNNPKIRPEIWSYGHRNSEGAAIDPITHQLWEIEFGPMGGDELNLIEAGKNYGWPIVSYGRNYDGTFIPHEHAARGFVEPVYYWDPVISPSGLIFYTGDYFKNWKDNLFLGGLSSQVLVRLQIKDNKVVQEERLLKGLNERIRDVVQGPDGKLYLLTDSNEGRVLKIEKKEI